MQHKMNRCVVKVVEGRHVHVEGHQFERGDRDSHGGAPGDLRAPEGVVATSEDPRRDTDREAGHDERGRGAQQPGQGGGVTFGHSGGKQQCAQWQVDGDAHRDKTQRPPGHRRAGAQIMVDANRSVVAGAVPGCRPAGGGREPHVEVCAAGTPRGEPVVQGYQQRCDDAARHRNLPNLETRLS